MTASEKQAEAPAVGKHIHDQDEMPWDSRDREKQKTSVMSVTGSAIARGPEMWSDMCEYLFIVIGWLLLIGNPMHDRVQEPISGSCVHE